MKHLFILFWMTTFFFEVKAQDYARHLPIQAGIQSNGSLQRIQFSVFDSTLSTTISYSTPWASKQLMITGNSYGKAGYIMWNSPGVQHNQVGFIIYDEAHHVFRHELVDVVFDSGLDGYASVYCGPTWIEVITEGLSVWSGDYLYTLDYYRFNPLYHKWVSYKGCYDFFSTQMVWNYPTMGNNDRIKDQYDLRFLFYDPVSDQLHNVLSPNFGLSNLIQEDDWFVNYGDFNVYEYFVYDASLSKLVQYPYSGLIGSGTNGIFHAYAYDSSSYNYFFVYDPEEKIWVTDTVIAANITNLKIKDRVITYRINSQVYCMAYHPVQNAWVKYSQATSGTVTGYKIENGTIVWSDANGAHTIGFNNSTGWGNYNTTPFLYFDLDDFTNVGYPMIYVRNLSIGTDAIVFNFGDGLLSLPRKNTLHHIYNTSGTYDVCISDSAGTQSWCQTVSINICATSGLISANAYEICEGDSVTLSIDSYNGVLQWQSFDGNIWVDETGAGSTSDNYTLYPLSTRKYRAKIVQGNCLPAFSNPIELISHPQISNYSVGDSLYSICQGSFVVLDVNNINCDYQWQKNTGSGWSNISGGLNGYINAYPTSSTQFRAVITSGNCFSDTSYSIIVLPDSTPGFPTVVGGTRCGPGIINLGASNGTNNIHWYHPGISDSVAHVGNTYSPYVSSTVNFSVAATMGIIQSMGLPDNSVGSISTTTGQNSGIRLQTTESSYLESVAVYPIQSGVINIKAYSQIGKLLFSKTTPVTATGTKSSINLGWLIPGKTITDIIIDSSSVPLSVNTNGFNYPLTGSTIPVTIIGYVDSTFHSANDFINIYDLRFTNGCKSSRKNVPAQVTPEFFGPSIISLSGANSFCKGDSLVLAASTTAGLTFKWLRNGIFTGQTGFLFTVKEPGTYQLVSYNNGLLCEDTSSSVRITMPCIQALEPEEKTAVSAYFDQDETSIIINTIQIKSELDQVVISDPSGRIIIKHDFYANLGEDIIRIKFDNFSSGLYFVTIANDKHKITKKIIKY
ncbi:MAG: T9SS type A sorting domain-containing protein [Bacteroidetes bacterium]|nr:T9SS type A sorting domain-containing protein [Bacteroidota bacterium]